jgi:hypothetical protein
MVGGEHQGFREDHGNEKGRTDCGRTYIFQFEEVALHTSDEFQMVCVDCGSLAITIANPEETNREAIVHCGGCNSPRGTMGGLRDLAVRAEDNVLPMRRRTAKSPSDLVARHKELQSLRRMVQIAESKEQARPPVLTHDREASIVWNGREAR